MSDIYLTNQVKILEGKVRTLEATARKLREANPPVSKVCIEEFEQMTAEYKGLVIAFADGVKKGKDYVYFEALDYTLQHLHVRDIFGSAV